MQRKRMNEPRTSCKHYVKKLRACESRLKANDPKTNAKTYWSMLKTFFNGKMVPVIPQFLLIDNKLMSNFEVKTKQLYKLLA